MPKTSEDLFRRPRAAGEFVSIQHAADADFFRRQGNEPEPFILQAHNDRVAGPFAGIEPNTGEMAKNGQLFQSGVDDAQSFLVPGQIAPSAGIDEEGRAQGNGATIRTTRFYCDGVGQRAEAGGRPALAHFSARLLSMLEEQVIEGGPLDLEGLGVAS